MNQIGRFEKQNPDFAIYVYGYDQEGCYTLHASENNDGKKMQICLLLLSNEYTSHYCWIKNRNKLWRSEVTKHHGNHEFCLRCHSYFQTKEKLEEHVKDCSKFGAVRIVMPVDEDGNPQHFSFNDKKLNRKMWVPFIVYADMESVTKKIDTCQPNPNQSFTQQYQRHEVSGWSYIIKSSDDENFQSIMKTCTAIEDGGDMGGDFIRSLEADIKKIYETVDFNKPLDESTVDYVQFSNAKVCHI